MPFLTAEWRDLAMLHYEVDPAFLASRVPAGTELDRWNGRTFVSLVGFRFLRTRVLGVGIPFHRDFEELNLRFYVRRKAAEGWRRGVVFVREIVPRRAVAWTARLVYNEPYVAHRMRHAVSSTRAAYAWRAGGRWHEIAVQPGGAAALPAPESLEAFLIEQHWGYTRQRDGGTVEYHVAHPPWLVRKAAISTMDADVVTTYGPEFAFLLFRVPDSACFVPGSEVAVHGGVRLPSASP